MDFGDDSEEVANPDKATYWAGRLADVITKGRTPELEFESDDARGKYDLSRDVEGVCFYKEGHSVVSIQQRKPVTVDGPGKASRYASRQVYLMIVVVAAPDSLEEVKREYCRTKRSALVIVTADDVRRSLPAGADFTVVNPCFRAEWIGGVWHHEDGSMCMPPKRSLEEQLNALTKKVMKENSRKRNRPSPGQIKWGISPLEARKRYRQMHLVTFRGLR